MDIDLNPAAMGFIVCLTLVSTGLFVFCLSNYAMGIVGFMVGLVGGCMIVGIVQDQEIRSWQYEDLKIHQGRDCNVDAAILKANADGVIKLVEYKRIRNMIDAVKLKAARDDLARIPTVKCRG